MRFSCCVFALVASASFSVSARAQQSASDSSRAINDSVVVAPSAFDSGRTAIRSSIDQPSDAVRRHTPALETAMAQKTAGLGRAKAMMIVGGAGIIVGSIIGGDGGQLVMLAGAGVGLYGLWLYLQ